MSRLLEIPEVAGLDARRGLVRIPPELDVPLTERVRRLIDTPQFRRLARISQLGLVALVYPAAIQSRFEHSLGVYRLALLFLKRLAHDPRFTRQVEAEDGQLLIAAALLHDLGHWPFCHPIEDIQLQGVPTHERFVETFIMEGEMADALHEDWDIQPRRIVDLLRGDPPDRRCRLLASILSGPIDIDKMDYLFRDSLHAGVPYGRHFDQQRLIGSLCLNARGDGLAITDKGKTAAELMVFARYVMFSEVYWHHGVRSATAMLQRAFYLLYRKLDLNHLFRLSESEMIRELCRAGSGQPAGELLEGLFGPVRRLYKRLAHYSFFEHGDVYRRLARRPYPWLVACSEQLAQLLSAATGQKAAGHEILFDAPPVAREVEFKVDVYYPKEDRYRPLAEVSPVVRTLAHEQFDDYVKRVRIFAHPRVAATLRRLDNLTELVHQAADRTDG
ncbi:MAG TPA: HD domain-containing protein [Planctomycetaceae bacterium]|nr:HD domain-containing protein [Planctomycetaceae bacterium]